MRKTLALIAVLATSLFAFHDMTFTPSTVEMFEEVEMSGTYEETGATATIMIFYDMNDNGTFQEGTDLDLMAKEGMAGGIPFNDGPGGFDPDSVEDGEMNFSIQAGSFPFNIPGPIVIVMEDGGESDKATLTITEASTSTTVSGMVSGPSGPLETMLVTVEFDLDGNEMQVAALTDDQGEYSINLPDEMQGETIRVIAEDGFGKLDAILIAPETIDTVGEASLILDFEFTEGTQFAQIMVEDENGDPVEGLPLKIALWDRDVQIAVTSDADGEAVIPVVPGNWEIETDFWQNAEYMVNRYSFEITEDETTYVTYEVHSTDEVITGVLTDEEGAMMISPQTCRAMAGVVDTENGKYSFFNVALINEDGSFSINVSSDFSEGYAVMVEIDEMPQGYYINPQGIFGVTPEDSPVEFAIVQADGEIKGTALIDGEPLPWQEIGLADTAQGIMMRTRTNENGDYTFSVPVGTYIVGYSDCSSGPCADVRSDEVVIDEGGHVIIDFEDGEAIIRTSGISQKAEGVLDLKASLTASAGIRDISFSFVSPFEGQARLDVYDLSGRHLATILNGTAAKGWNTATWNSVPSNAVIARLHLNGLDSISKCLKVMRVK